MRPSSSASISGGGSSAEAFIATLLRAHVGACLENERRRDQLVEWNRTRERRLQDKAAAVERLGRLTRCLSPQLVELIVADRADDPLKTHRTEATVVWLDLRGFTAFAETAEPEEVMGGLRAIWPRLPGDPLLDGSG